MSGEESLPAAIEDVEEGWSPRGEADVERALRGLERLSAKFAAIGARSVEWQADIQAWEAQEVARLRAVATPLVLGLQSWAKDRRLASHGKDKRFRFPSGEIWTTSGASKTEITDEAALVAFCEDGGSGLQECLKITKTVLRSKLMKLDGIRTQDGKVLLGGEIVPGIRHIEGGAWVSAEVKLASQRALPPGTQG